MKKKKKYLWGLLTILMVTVVSVGFISCGEDDENKDMRKEVSIVGIWEWSEGDDFSRIIFNENGTGHDLYLWRGHVDFDADFTYRYDSKTMTLTMKYGEGEEFSGQIKGLTERTLIVERLDTDKQGNKVYRSYTRRE